LPILTIPNKAPRIHETAFVCESAHVIGDVTVGPHSSIWFGSVVRGDVHFIRIGARTNIQDLSVVHVTHETHPTTIEDDVTVGHSVTLHGCHVKSRVLVGIGAILLDGVVVESDSMIAAGSLLAPGTRVPSGVLMMGSPARPKRDLTDDERKWILKSAMNYVGYQEMYR
jgi:carbonic anhydrase/acetyltransferase-like protein (isoleucine patch superfamily)